MYIQFYTCVTLLGMLLVVLALPISRQDPEDYIKEWSGYVAKIKQIKNTLFYDIRGQTVQLNTIHIYAEAARNRISEQLYKDLKGTDEDFYGRIDQLTKQHGSDLPEDAVKEAKYAYRKLKQTLNNKVSKCMSLKFTKWSAAKTKCDALKAKLIENVGIAKDAMILMKQLLEAQTTTENNSKALDEIELKIKEAHEKVQDIEYDDIPSLKDDTKALADMRKQLGNCYSDSIVEDTPNSLKLLKRDYIALIDQLEAKIGK